MEYNLKTEKENMFFEYISCTVKKNLTLEKNDSEINIFLIGLIYSRYLL